MPIDITNGLLRLTKPPVTKCTQMHGILQTNNKVASMHFVRNLQDLHNHDS
jgi:hypothetical protein